MSLEHASGIAPEVQNPAERKRFWINTADKIYQQAQMQNLPLVFRGSLHAEFLQPGFIKDGYKQEKRAWRDIDLLLLGQPDEEIERQLQVAAGEVRIGFGANEYLHFDEQDVSLTYKDIAVPIEPSLFEPQYMTCEGKTLPFLDPLVHYHLFETVGFGGVFGGRIRDRKKMYLYKNSPSRYANLAEDEKKRLFKPFYEYRKLRAKQYPIETIANKLRGDIPAPANTQVRRLSRQFFRSLNATPIKKEGLHIPSCLDVSNDPEARTSEGKEVQVMKLEDSQNTPLALKAYFDGDSIHEQLEIAEDIRGDIDEFHSLGLDEQIPPTDFFIAEDPATGKPRLYALQPWIEGKTLRDTSLERIINDEETSKSLSDLLIGVSKYQELFGYMPDTVGAHGLRVAGKRIPAPANLLPFLSNNIMIDDKGKVYFIDPHVRKTADAQGKIRGMLQSASTKTTGEILKHTHTPQEYVESPDVQRVKEYLETIPGTSEQFEDGYFRDDQTEQKKLLIVTNYPPGEKLNGLDFTVRMLMRYLHVNNSDSVLLTASSSDKQIFDPQLGRIIMCEGLQLSGRLPGIIAGTERIKEIIETEKPEGVVLFNPLILGQQVADAASKSNIPVAATADTRVGQYIRYQIPDPIGKTLAHRIDHIDYAVKKALPVQTWIAPSDSYRKRLEENGIKHVKTISREGSYGNHEIPPRDMHLHQLIAPNGELVLLNVGKVSRVKNIEFLARVARLLDRSDVPYKMVFVGNNSDPKEFDRIRKQFRTDRSLFLGSQDGDRLMRLYSAADLCLQPSNTETLGLVSIEALTAGVPVLAADSIGNRDTVIHNQNGKIMSTTEPGDAKKWAGIISDLIQHPEELDSLRNHTGYPSYVAQSWREYGSDIVGLFK